jgi:hypothetical protein
MRRAAKRENAFSLASHWGQRQRINVMTFEDAPGTLDATNFSEDWLEQLIRKTVFDIFSLALAPVWDSFLIIAVSKAVAKEMTEAIYNDANENGF